MPPIDDTPPVATTPSSTDVVTDPNLKKVFDIVERTLNRQHDVRQRDDEKHVWMRIAEACIAEGNSTTAAITAANSLADAFVARFGPVTVQGEPTPLA